MGARMVETQAQRGVRESWTRALPPVWPELWACHPCLGCVCRIGLLTGARTLNCSGKVSWGLFSGG